MEKISLTLTLTKILWPNEKSDVIFHWKSVRI